jgi:hypothetical protein
LLGTFTFQSQLHNVMSNDLVTRNQFNVTPDGVVHKPTDAALIPNPSDPSSGTVRLGQLANAHPTAREYPVDEVLRIMGELWAEFRASNPERFNSKS